MTAIDEAKALLTAEGYVVLKAKSYYQAQERQRTERVLREAAEREIASTTAWAHGVCDSERHLRDRCTYLYGLAASLGASDNQLHRVRFDPNTERDSNAPIRGRRMTTDLCEFCDDLWQNHTEAERRSCLADLRAQRDSEWAYLDDHGLSIAQANPSLIASPTDER